jgi:hypothetical protein
MVGSEVFSSEVKKTEVLMENFRRAIGEFNLFISSTINHQPSLLDEEEYTLLIQLQSF